MIERLFELAGITVDNDLLLEAAYDGMIDSIKKNFPNNIKDIDDNVKQAKTILKKQDRIVWYLKVLKAFLSNNINNVKGSYNFKDMETFNNDLFHYYGYNLGDIENTELANQNISELFQSFQATVQQYQKSDKPPVPIQEGDKELIKCNDGTSWWFVNRAYCEEEGRSGKHCGNIVGKNETDQRILSLRTPNHNVILTFILLKNGYLGEMKAKANQKPSQKYHPNIMQLLLNPKIKGIKGAGYAPYMNFSIFDLSEQNIELLIYHGKQKFITDQIKAEPIEFLKAPNYIKNNKEYQQVAIKSLPALKYLIGNEQSLGAWENAIHEHNALIIYAPPTLHNFTQLVTNRLKYYPEDLLKAPKSVSQNFDILKDVLEYDGDHIAYIIPTTPKYDELCKIAVTYSAGALEHIQEDYITADICKVAVSNYGSSIYYVPEKFKTQELCISAVEQSTYAIKYVPEQLKSYELCKIAVNKDSSTIAYVPTNIKNYEELCKIAVADIWTNFNYIPEQFKTYEICKIAIGTSSHNIEKVPTTIKDYDKLCKYAVSLNGAALSGIPKQFRTNELCTIAVNQTHRAIEHVPTTVEDYDKLCKIAVSKNGEAALRKIPMDYRTLDICLLAVEQDSDAISEVPYEIRDTVRQKLNLNESLDFKYFQTL